MSACYAEVWLPDGEAALEHATLTTFQEAIAWLLLRREHNPSLIVRVHSAKQLGEDDLATLRRYEVHLELNYP